jgi:hypothetical protein
MMLDLALAARINPPLQAATIGGSGGFSCYRSLSETQISMRQLALDYPGLVRSVDYGDSWDKAASAQPILYLPLVQGGAHVDSWDETTRESPAGHDL